jgi:hypothetical protein
MTDSARVEPEPIDAEFEPAENAPQVQPSRRLAPRGMRSRSVTWTHLITASGISAVAAATVAIIVNNAASNAPTGTLAREIDSLTQALETIQAQSEQASVDIVSLRSRLDSHGDRLNRTDTVDASLRTDLAALASQVSALSGAGDGTVPAGSAASATPLGVLLARINKLERIVADATSAPETTREVQRAVADLALQVAELNLANTTMVSAFDRREAALAALESGMQQIAAQLGREGVPAKPGGPMITLATVAAPPQQLVDATARAQTIRALSVLEAAARTDNSFARAHEALAEIIPGDAALAAIASMAESGVPTLATLRATFDTTATRAMRHANDDSDDGWNWLRQAFEGVVSFAPSQLETQTAGTLRTARRQLDIGSIREAVTAVSSLPDFAAWREKALKRAALEDALKSLNTRLLTASTSPPIPPG